MQKILGILAVFLWGTLILVAFMVYGASGHDDPHGNLWFAHTMLEYGKFFNYNGDYVQQNTGLLQVWLTVLLVSIYPLDLITYGYAIDPFAGFVCCFLVTGLARRLCPAVVFWPALIMLSSVSFELWMFGGMGGTLAAMCLLLAVRVWWAYVEFPQQGIWQFVGLVATTVALVLVRPEFPLVIVAVALFLFILHCRDKARRARFLHILLLSTLGCALIFIWQKYYFSSWLPLPIFSKIAGLMDKFLAGYRYLLMYSLGNPMVVLALIFSPLVFWFFYRSEIGRPVWRGEKSTLTLLLLLVAFFTCYFCFVWLVGGDWMQAGRFVAPMVPLASLLAVVMLSLVIRHAIALRLLFVLLMFWSLRWAPSLIAADNHGVPVWTPYRLDPAHENYTVFEKYNQEHLRDMAVIDHLAEMIPLLHHQLGRPVSLLSGQLGMVKYRLAQRFYGTGQLKFMDFRAIYDDTFVRCPVLADVIRTPMGLGWDYRQYFKLQAAFKSECNIDYPDIIYDLDSLGNTFQPDFERAGYTLVHREEGFVLVNKSPVRSHIIFVPNMIYVKNELIPMLGNPELRVISYKTLPLVYRPENVWLEKMGLRRYLQ